VKKYRISLVALLLVMALTFLTACGGNNSSSQGEQPDKQQTQQQEEKKIRVAAVFPGSIQDMGWNQSGYEALMQLKDEGFEVSYQENVDQSQVKDVLRNYAADGYNLVIGHDLFFTDPVIEVAPEFPDTMFGISGGAKSASNVASVTGTNWESAYLTGAFAGLVTKTNKVGIINASDGDIARRMRNAFELGARVYNPEAVAVHTFTGSWDDSVKGKELAKAMAKEGVDIILTQSGQANVGAIEGCQEAGILAIGAPTDLSQIAPDTIAATALIPPGAMLYNLAHMFADGTLKGELYVQGVKEGAEDIIIHHEVPQEIIDKVMQVRQDLVDKKVPTPEI
jgi:basic membrane protein A